MNDLTVFAGGPIGFDPRDAKTWSGISPSLVKALDDDHLLAKAVGVKLSPALNYLLMAKNFSPKRSVWRKHFYFDVAYRNAMTRAAAKIDVESPCCLQFGHWYNNPKVFPAKKCLSYHDGNLPGALSAGFGMEGVSRKRIDEALRFEEETANGMAAVLTLSEYVRQSFIHDYHVPPERVFNVGAGFNLPSIPPVGPKDYTAPQIMYLGGEFLRKGGAVLLEAFGAVRQRVPEATLHIVGPLHLENVPAGVVFHGQLLKTDPEQRAKLESIFRTSNVFALPSLYEPFGIAPLEAMLYRIPCVLTNAWAFKEFVAPGFNGELAEKGSAEDLAAKLLLLLSDPAKLALMGDRCRERVLSHYTWPAVSRRIGTIVASLAS